MELVQLQIAVSTAEDEQSYFVGQHSPEPRRPPSSPLAGGVYRVVDGELFQVVPGVPPVSGSTTLPAERDSAG